MSAFLTLDSVALVTPEGRLLFEGLTLSVGRERIGLVGRNGSGKSTLLRMIAEGRPPDAGHILCAGRTGVLEQTLDDDLTVGEALGVADGLARLRRLETGEGSVSDAADADWTLEPRLEAALDQAGLSGVDLTRLIAGFSGGERTRIALAGLTLSAPDLLLLDEPTNNLDGAGRMALAGVLEDWRGGVMIASHDRNLLERMDRIVELTPVGVTVFGGPWSAFQASRDAARARAEIEVDRAAQALRRTEREAQTARERQDRRDRAGRAKRAKGDAPKILLDARAERAEHTAARGRQVADRLVSGRTDGLEAARARIEVLTPLSIDLPRCGLPAGRELLAFDKVVMRRGERRLFGPLSFGIRGPERIAVSGANGAGKTTLLRLAVGEIEPMAGSVQRLTGRTAVLDQHVGLLDPTLSVLENLRRLNPGVSDHGARAILARFAFRNTAALQVAGNLSGGERMRAGLACIFAPEEPPELLLLDEPTNHLDLTSIQVLEQALAGYDGALLAVSHDAAFLDAIGTDRTITL